MLTLFTLCYFIYNQILIRSIQNLWGDKPSQISHIREFVEGLRIVLFGV